VSAIQANTRVAMARYRPRTRSDTAPSSAATPALAAAATAMLSGKGTCHLAVATAVTKAPMPTSSAWAREICPTQPVSSTTDSATMT
jgi:hypothetical protein